jgi:hypothetical protein
VLQSSKNVDIHSVIVRIVVSKEHHNRFSVYFSQYTLMKLRSAIFPPRCSLRHVTRTQSLSIVADVKLCEVMCNVRMTGQIGGLNIVYANAVNIPLFG